MFLSRDILCRMFESLSIWQPFFLFFLKHFFWKRKIRSRKAFEWCPTHSTPSPPPTLLHSDSDSFLVYYPPTLSPPGRASTQDGGRFDTRAQHDFSPPGGIPHITAPLSTHFPYFDNKRKGKHLTSNLVFFNSFDPCCFFEDVPASPGLLFPSSANELRCLYNVITWKRWGWRQKRTSRTRTSGNRRCLRFVSTRTTMAPFISSCCVFRLTVSSRVVAVSGGTDFYQFFFFFLNVLSAQAAAAGTLRDARLTFFARAQTPWVRLPGRRSGLFKKTSAVISWVPSIFNLTRRQAGALNLLSRLGPRDLGPTWE